VIGPSFVAIYDYAILEKSGRFYFLKAGDRFDLVKREATRPGYRMQELRLPEAFQSKN
jgi:hypothetical protein